MIILYRTPGSKSPIKEKGSDEEMVELKQNGTHVENPDDSNSTVNLDRLADQNGSVGPKATLKKSKESKRFNKPEALRESAITQVIRLLSYTKYNGRYFLCGSLFLIIYSTCRIFLPYFTGEIIAQIVRKDSYADGTFHKMVFGMLALTLIG